MTSRELVFAGKVAAFASAVPLLARMRLSRLEHLLRPRRRSLDRLDPGRRLEVIEMVLARVVPVVDRSCLTRGLTRWVFLNRGGIPAELIFGVGRPRSGAFAGHCWVLVEGQPYREHRDPREAFHEVVRFAASG